MAKIDTLRDQLTDVGTRRAAARDDLRQTTVDIKRLAPRALAAGMTKVELAQRAGITRAALDAMLG